MIGGEGEGLRHGCWGMDAPNDDDDDALSNNCIFYCSLRVSWRLPCAHRPCALHARMWPQQRRLRSDSGAR